MLIQHEDASAARLSHDGVVYDSVAPGVFDVPPDVAEALLRFVHWSPAEAPPEPAVGTDWYAAGRNAAERGQPRELPASAGLHPRSREARDYFRGWDSVRSGGE